MTEQEKPNPLEYQTASDGNARQKGLDSKRFLLGLAGGTAFSALVWLSVYSRNHTHVGGGYFASNAVGSAMLAVPILKILAAICCFAIPGWRSCGAGISLSLILGFLIFLGLCGMGMN